MDLKDLFGTDKAKEKKGTWIEIMTNDDDSVCRVKVMRMGASNRQFLIRWAAVSKRSRGNLSGVPTEAEVKALIEAFVDTVMVDWENVRDFRMRDKPEAFPTNGDGKLVFIPYSRENAIFVFNELPDMFDYVVEESKKLQNFQNQANEVEAKNS